MIQKTLYNLGLHIISDFMLEGTIQLSLKREQTLFGRGTNLGNSSYLYLSVYTTLCNLDCYYGDMLDIFIQYTLKTTTFILLDYGVENHLGVYTLIVHSTKKRNHYLYL